MSSPGPGSTNGEVDRLVADAGRLLQSGAAERAITVCREVLKKAPNQPVALHLLGAACSRAGDLAGAVPPLVRLLGIQPGNADAHLLLGMAYEGQNRLDDALNAYRQALALRSGWPEAGSRLGGLLRRTKRFDEAIACYRSVLAIHPDDDTTIFNLAIALHRAFRFEEAAACYQTILQRHPNDAETWVGLANVMKDSGQVATARACNLKALQLRPDYREAFSNLLFVEAYHVLCPAGELLEHHRAWAQRFAPDERAGRFDFSGRLDGDRRLRIGYVSPDLRRHPVGTFVEGLLRAHDRSRFEVYCYDESRSNDEVNRRLRSYAQAWRKTIGQGDEAVARQIYEDRIDILVDLAGHTRGNRLGVFAYRPAPVQVTYLGYCATTGLSAMDYWLVDEALVPEDSVESTTEEIWRLPRCWITYEPVADAPEVAERTSGGAVTFGCFNDLSKLGDEVVATWAEILNRVPGSRLLLKAAPFNHEAGRHAVVQRFTALGVDPERLILRPRTPDYLKEYGDMDIALDPFPRTGGATTADALWMGVPVVTMAGARMIERQGVSMLRAIGLADCIAESREDYVNLAVGLAGDDERRRALRAALRERVRKSELCDAAGMARAIEAAYLGMWKRLEGAF
ncbi:MAG: tetratricopeptide repeat protein [Gammaproteobacteria bacterium]|nr:tetratricopeptide repeat protein [Gammaproteobacteria bacterium]